MSEHIQLIVGLGNPGAQYDHTRHNAGFDFLDLVASHFGIGSWTGNRKYQADICNADIAGRKTVLMKPQTFMNKSGLSVGGYCNFFKIPPAGILVCYDELDLPPGTARLKTGGGHGGHNGIRDIIASLGNQKDFNRLRLGVGHPGSAPQVVNYVLGKAPASERELITQAMDEAVRSLPTILSHWHKGMTELNSFKAS